MLESVQRSIFATLAPSGPRGRLTILTFHQVPRTLDPMAPMVAAAPQFRAQMSWLRDYCQVLPLAEAAEGLANGTLPARAAAITFDDGYLNNLTVAAPILRELDLPATVFVTSGAVEAGVMWNDVIIEAFRHADGKISLPGEVGIDSAVIANDEQRRQVCQQTIDAIKYRKLEERLGIARAVFDALRGGQAPRLMMTPDQVGEITGFGFDVGAHTVNHAILKELPDEQSRSEIIGSRDWVESVTGRRPVSFAYPNGRPGVDFTERESDFVADAGFDVAVRTRWAAARPGDSTFALPRYKPWELTRNGYWFRLCKTVAKSYLRG
ncbi:MAG: polysaccharide deacetylase family protein [Pseudomonadota bacterium]